MHASDRLDSRCAGAAPSSRLDWTGLVSIRLHSTRLAFPSHPDPKTTPDTTRHDTTHLVGAKKQGGPGGRSRRRGSQPVVNPPEAPGPGKPLGGLHPRLERVDGKERDVDAGSRQPARHQRGGKARRGGPRCSGGVALPVAVDVAVVAHGGKHKKNTAV